MLLLVYPVSRLHFGSYPRRRKLRRFFLPLAALALAAALVAWVAPAFFDAEKVTARIVSHLQEVTGRTMSVKGDAEIRLLPSPAVMLNSIELPADEAFATPVLRAERLRVYVPWGTLFGGSEIESVALEEPVLELLRPRDSPSPPVNLASVLIQLFLPSGLATAPSLPPVSMAIENGKILYLDAQSGQQQRAEEIYFSVRAAGGGYSLKGRAVYEGIPLEAGISFAPDAEGAFSARLSQGEENFVQLTGTLAGGGEAGAFSGRVEATLADPSKFAPFLADGLPAAGDHPVAQPLTLSADASYKNDILSLQNLVFEMQGSAGSGSATLKLESESPGGEIALRFSRLELARGNAGALLAGLPELPPAFALRARLAADSASFNGTQLSNASLNIAYEQGAWRVESLAAQLGEDAAFRISGAVEETAKGPRFTGATQTEGRSLRALLALFDPAAAQLPENMFGAFSLHANMFASSEQFRLSEAELQLGELKLGGGLVTYFEATPRVEADVLLQNINLDYFRDRWRAETTMSGSDDFFLTLNSGVDFSWLKQLSPTVNLQVTLDGFRFLDQSGERGSFRIFAKKNNFALQNIELNYGKEQLKGRFGVDVSGETPMLDVALQAPRFDSAYFSTDGKGFGKGWVDPAGEPRWSRELFDLRWMIGVGGALDISIGTLAHHGEDYNRFILQGKLANEQLQLNRLSFNRFGGTAEVKGTLSGGRVPGISASFTLYNADIASLLSAFMRQEKISGRVSLSGTVVASGTSFYEWLRQADVKTTIAARGVRTRGFFLQGAVDGVNAARSVAEVVANVNRALPAGSTDFAVDGNINLLQGVARTPGLSLTAGRAKGTLTGELRLLEWKMALAALFQLPMLASETVPTLTVELTGTPEEYAQKLDTSSLEAYVAKRIVGR